MTGEEQFQHCTYPSPVGTILVGSSNKGLRNICFDRTELNPASEETVPKTCKYLSEASKWLDSYFSSRPPASKAIITSEYKQSLLKNLEGTTFQKKVWKELMMVSFGETISYSSLASSLGKPRAHRAVASACARNPLMIIVPCHRVLRKNGALGGFRGGLSRKKDLLLIENQQTGA